MYPDTKSSNEFVTNLSSALERAGASVTAWETRDSVDRPDVALLHWYENSWERLGIRPQNRLRNWRERRQKLEVLDELIAAGTRICWTAHNSMPHSFVGSRQKWERRTRHLFGRMDAVAHLTRASMESPDFARLSHLPAVVARHPHYDLVDAADHAGNAGEVSRVLLLGAISARKNYLASVDLVLKSGSQRIVVAGSPRDSRTMQGLHERKAAFPDRIEVIDRFLPKDELYSLFDGKTAVMVNQPAALNSGVMYLALSRGAPVVCPPTPTNVELAGLLTTSWVRAGDMSSERVGQALREPVSPLLPDMSEFSSDRTASSLMQLFTEIAGE